VGREGWERRREERRREGKYTVLEESGMDIRSDPRRVK
jgi:hypothetical protein